MQLRPITSTQSGTIMSGIGGNTKPIRVLIVDDSPTIRKMIAAALAVDPNIQIVSEAADAIQARDAVKALNPDVITLDVEMPGMDGIEFLRRLMQRRPTPVIMVSSLTGRGSSKALEALTLGAIDCIGKPTAHGVTEALAELRAKVHAAANARVTTAKSLGDPACKPSVHQRRKFTPNDRMVFIGSSTGGVDAVSRILSKFPMNCPPTVIVQHMPSGFTKKFAERLSRICAPDVQEAQASAVLRPGLVLLAPGGERHLQVTGRARFSCELISSAPVSDHRPSVDMLFGSAAKLGRRAVGVLLTGMGHDGADGLLKMRQNNAETIAQNSETSVVFGMPRVAAELGAVQHVLPLEQIGEKILELCNGP